MQLPRVWVVPKTSNPPDILFNAASYNRMKDLISSHTDDLIKEQILHGWIPFVQALHWVYRENSDNAHRIPDWENAKKQVRQAIKAQGNYLLALLQLYGAMKYIPKKFNQYMSFDDVIYFSESCWELLQDSYLDCINNTRQKSSIIKRNSEISGKLRKNENPYSLSDKPFLSSAHNLAIEYVGSYSAVAKFKKTWRHYLYAYTNFIKDLKNNSAWVCLFVDDKNRIAYHLPGQGYATQLLYSQSTGKLIPQVFPRT